MLSLADISAHQADVDWTAYAAERNAIILKVSQGKGYPRAGSDDDVLLSRYRREANRRLSFVGLYCFADARETAKANVDHFLGRVGTMAPKEMAILDAEALPDAHGNIIHPGPDASWCREWHGQVQRALGRPLMLYCSKSYFEDKLGSNKCGFEVLWMARYGPRPNPKKWDLWQFTNGEINAVDVPGIGRCDDNVFEGSIEELVALAGGGGQGFGPNPPTPEVRMFIYSTAPNVDAGSFWLVGARPEPVRLEMPQDVEALTKAGVPVVGERSAAFHRQLTSK